MEHRVQVFVDFNLVPEEPAIHVLFGKTRYFYVRDIAYDHLNLYAAAGSLCHLTAEDGTREEVTGQDGNMGMGISKHFQITLGNLAFPLHPIISSYPYHAFFM